MVTNLEYENVGPNAVHSELVQASYGIVRNKIKMKKASDVRLYEAEVDGETINGNVFANIFLV